MPDEATGGLLEAIERLNERLEDAARLTATLDARIDALPTPTEIAAAVDAEVQRNARNVRDEIGARVGSLDARLDALARRVAETADALAPLEGLRTEIAVVADENSGLKDIKTRLERALEQLSEIATRKPSDAESPEEDAGFRRLREALEETAAGIRSDFEVLVRGELQASERRSDALGLRITNLSLGVTKTLEDLAAQTQRIADRARTLEAENAAILQAVKEEVAAMSAGGADAVRARIESLNETFGMSSKETLERLTQRMDAIDTRIAEGIAALETRAHVHEPDPTIAEINERLASLPRQEHEVIDLSPVTAEIERARASIEASSASVDAAVSTVEQLRGTVEQLRAHPEETTGESDRSRAELLAIVERLGDQLVARTANLNAEIVERSTRLEDRLATLPTIADVAAALPAAMPSASDLSAAIGDRISAAMAETKRELDGRFVSLEQELSGVATNVNETWIRVRALVKGLEDERAAAREEATTSAARIDQLSKVQEQLRSRLMETERGLVEAVRTIENERDRVFLSTLAELLEKLPRRERKLFRRRVEEIALQRGEAPVATTPPAGRVPSEELAPAPVPGVAASTGKQRKKKNRSKLVAKEASSNGASGAPGAPERRESPDPAGSPTEAGTGAE